MPLQLDICKMHIAIGNKFHNQNDAFNELKELNVTTADTFRYGMNNIEPTHQISTDVTHVLDNLASAAIRKMKQWIN